MPPDAPEAADATGRADQPVQIDLPDEAATAAWAKRLATCPSLDDALIALEGDLGAGKTTLARALLRALGIMGRIKSPTFAVLETYEAPPASGWPQGLAVSHVDFYRFEQPREWDDAGLREVFAEPGLKLVEWPQRAAGLMPAADLVMALTVREDNSRGLTLQAQTPRGRRLLAEARI